MADDTHRAYRMVARAEQQQRTRARILEAAKDAVLRTPYARMRLTDVAAAAGVAPQTIHLHFGTKDDLYAAAAQEIGADVLALRGRPRPGDVDGVVAGLMRQYEHHGDSNWRVFTVDSSVPQVAEMVGMARIGHRAWLASALGPLLPPEHDERERALDALCVGTDVSAWKLLRRDLGCTREQTARALQRLVRGALAPDPVPGPGG